MPAFSWCPLLFGELYDINGEYVAVDAKEGDKMATSRTFEILWGKFENEQRAFEALELKISGNEIATDEIFKRLNIIKKNLEEISIRAQKELRDPWEEEMMIKSTDELLKKVVAFF